MDGVTKLVGLTELTNIKLSYTKYIWLKPLDGIHICIGVLVRFSYFK